MEKNAETEHGIKVHGNLLPEYETIVTAEALQFVAKLVRAFGERREELLLQRKQRQHDIDAGMLPDFAADTLGVREGDWTIAPIPNDLLDRRVEITGPAGDRKMVINALNSGAKTFMADFEDANSPTWRNTIEGQMNLRDAIRGTIRYVNPDGKEYRLKDGKATLIVRPRGWHLVEKHVHMNGRPIPASLFDFGLFFFHNAKALIDNGSGPYYYLPKIESYLEARLWNDVFTFAERELGIPYGMTKATVLIETITAAFEMDEILYELRDHAVGLNCGRWDYIFSYLKKMRNMPSFILPDRSQVTMMSPFMRAYSLLVIQTCHRRNAHAIGGMAAQIPIKDDPQANERAMNQVRADKEREVRDGHDGTWVAHPALVPIAMKVFDRHMPTANQIHVKRDEVRITARDLLEVPQGTITEKGMRTNISVGIRYIAAWLNGSGAVPLFHLMEDAATAEISRAQVWQWIRHPQGLLEDGRKVTVELFRSMLKEEIRDIQREIGEESFEKGNYRLAAQLFESLTLDDRFEEFLTIPGYEYL